MWTEFRDTLTGGEQKLGWSRIYIEADEETAIRVFEERFDRHPGWESCECCGEDFDVDTHENLNHLDEELKHTDVLVIPASELVCTEALPETRREGSWRAPEGAALVEAILEEAGESTNPTNSRCAHDQ
jgi:hypothetical protein